MVVVLGTKVVWYGTSCVLRGQKFQLIRVGSKGISNLQSTLEHFDKSNHVQRTDEEWLNAKDYDSMPGPSKLRSISFFLPGGKLYNSNLIDMHKKLRSTYGDIFRMRGILGKPDVVFTYNPADIEVTYRTEGVWPIRIGLDTFTYYRQVKRPDVFRGVGGLVSDQGKSWADFRNKVNPILMKVQNVRQNQTQIDLIATDFLSKLERERDPLTGYLKFNFLEELKMWAFESICYIALNTRMGLMTGKPDPNARRLAENLTTFFQLSYEYDVNLSFWQYYETAGFKLLMKTYDNITDITTRYIEAAMEKFEAEENEEAKSVLEKLCRVDKQIAIVMAMDMLIAGIDTTSSVFMTTIYLIATNPDKQEALRNELKTIMPERNTPLTQANTNNMPYLRACIKEALRITPITPGNFRLAGRDIVLSGYRVPKGTGVIMGVMELANSDKYFPQTNKFLPERWLKHGAAACPAAKATNPFVYLPFGFGPRTCIGKRIAEMELETLIAKIIRNYRVTWEDTKPLQYISNIIVLPKIGEVSFKFDKLD